MVNIPSDLRKNKDKIVGNMDLRELVCVFIGVTLAIAILYYFRVVLQIKRVVILAFLAGLVTIPFLAIGFKKVNGMKLDDYIRVFINNNVLSKSVRVNICPNTDKVLKDKKYEITRCYKLKYRLDLLKMRDYLKDKLILTEYLKLKDNMYAVFRLDGKDMILDYQKRNKEAIDNLTKKIKSKVTDLHKLKAKSKEEQVKINQDKLDIKKQIKDLKLEKSKLQKKKFNDIKNEVDIFEKLENVSKERTDNTKEIETNISIDTRKIYELNLFNKNKFKDFIDNNVTDRVIFINADDKVDIFLFDNDNLKDNAKEQVVDLLELDVKNGLYECIKNLKAWNFYNHYRCINKLEEIL